MTLLSTMTATATTQRTPAISSGKIGDPVTNLESVKITPVMLQDTRTQLSIRQAIGLEGTAVQVFEAYTQSHAHTDSSSAVTQMPDIRAGDRLITGGVTYVVRWAEQQPATASLSATLILYLTEDKRQ